MNSVSCHYNDMTHICIVAHYRNGGIVGGLWLVI
jgi:hypothetical protein